MLPGAAQEDLLGRGGRAVRVLLLGGLHAARQADLQEVRRPLHPDMVCHQLELFVLPAVLRGARLQVRREAVCEAEIQVGTSVGAGPTLRAPLLSAGAASGRGKQRSEVTVSPAVLVGRGSESSPLGVVSTCFLCLQPEEVLYVKQKAAIFQRQPVVGPQKGDNWDSSVVPSPLLKDLIVHPLSDPGHLLPPSLWCDWLGLERVALKIKAASRPC